MLEIFEIRVVFKGQVQGVGFRATAARLGNEIGLKGTARNLPDGSVEIVAQGTEELINNLVDTLKLKFTISAVILSEKTYPESIFDHFTIIA